jgi:hypothetical protein
LARTIRCAIAGSEISARDLARREAAERAQGEADAGLGRQRRVARGEDQPQPVVGDRAHERQLRFGLVLAAAERPQLGRQLDAAARPPALGADPVQRAVARGGDDPRRRVVGDPALGPVLERGDERVLDRLLGTVEVAEDACEHGDRLPRLAAEQTVDEDRLGAGFQAEAPEESMAPSIAV